MSRRHQPFWRNYGRSTATQMPLPRPSVLRSRTTVHNLCADLIHHGIGAGGPLPASGILLTPLSNTSTSRTTEENCQGTHGARDWGHDTGKSDRRVFLQLL